MAGSPETLPSAAARQTAPQLSPELGTSALGSRPTPPTAARISAFLSEMLLLDFETPNLTHTTTQRGDSVVDWGMRLHNCSSSVLSDLVVQREISRNYVRGWGAAGETYIE